MRICRRCGGYCDPGDLVGGVCTDCIEREYHEEERNNLARQMLARNKEEEENGQLTLLV